MNWMLTSNERGREQEAGAAGHRSGVRRTYAAAGDSRRVRSTRLGEGGGRAGGAGGDGAITPRVLQVVNASVKAQERERERERERREASLALPWTDLVIATRTWENKGGEKV